MTGEKEAKFRLFVLHPDRKEEAEKHRFHRLNSRYALVYTKEMLENAGEITESELWRLNQGERDWLDCCNVSILFDDARERKADILEILNEKMERLENELKKRADSDFLGAVPEKQV